MTTLDDGRSSTCRLPRFSALESVLRASPSTLMRTMVNRTRYETTVKGRTSDGGTGGEVGERGKRVGGTSVGVKAVRAAVAAARASKTPPAIGSRSATQPETKIFQIHPIRRGLGKASSTTGRLSDSCGPRFMYSIVPVSLDTYGRLCTILFQYVFSQRSFDGSAWISTVLGIY